MRKKRTFIYFIIIIFSTFIFMNNILAENIEIEAEKYDNKKGRPKFAPFKVKRDSKASKGKYITCLKSLTREDDFDDDKINDKTDGQVHYKFKLKEKGSIDIYVRVNSDNSRKDAFYYTVKGIDKKNDWIKVTNVKTKGWMWMNCASYNDIEDGTYTFKIIHGRNKIKIDKIFISLDGKQPKGEILDAGSIGKRKKKGRDYVELTEAQRIEIKRIKKDYTIYEAENGRVEGCDFRSKHEGFSGKGYVNFGRDLRAKLEIRVKVKDKKVYKVLLRYSNKNNPRAMEISVNKKVVYKSYAFPSTGANTGYKTVVLEMELKKGKNKILFMTIGEEDSKIDFPNIDLIGIEK